ncbi:MAG: YXWGXW repeat-containing protein [Myxococcales bacterium]|nr:YXWGXW repeat-containing protein [Myxococcales bacterium]
MPQRSLAHRLSLASTALLLLCSSCIIGRPRWQATWNDPWHNGWLDPGQPVAAQAPPAAVQVQGGPVGVGGAGQVWVDGHYEWIDQRYTWVDGHWANPPQPGWEWQQPAWHNGRWHRGFWHARNAQIDPVYTQHHGAWNPGWHGNAHATPVAHPVTLETAQPVAQPVATPVGGSVTFGASVSGGVGAVATPVR